MGIHESNLGVCGRNIPTDKHGYIPTADDGPWDLDFDHGIEQTHDDDCGLTEYGVWWEDEGFPEVVRQAIVHVEAAQCEIYHWQKMLNN